MPGLTEKSLKDNILTARIVRSVNPRDKRIFVVTPDGMNIALRRDFGVKNIARDFTVASTGKTYRAINLTDTVTDQYFFLSIFQMNVLDKDLRMTEDEYERCKMESIEPEKVSKTTPVKREEKETTEKILDDAYAEAVRVFSLALKKVPAPDRATRGIASMLSDECGGSGIVYINRIDMRSKLAHQLKKWGEKRPKIRVNLDDRSLSLFGMVSDPSIYKVPDEMLWAQAQCTDPHRKAYQAFLDYLKKKGIDTGCAYVRVIID